MLSFFANNSLTTRRALRSLLIGLSLFAVAAMFPAASFCLVQKLCQVPCPACGGTRSVVALLHLRFLDSFRWNPGLWLGSLTFLGVLLGCHGSQAKYRQASKYFLIVGFFVGLLRIVLSVYCKNQSFFFLNL